MKKYSSNILRWWQYYRQISHRVHFDRSFISSGIMVGKIYLHYAIKNLRKPSEKHNVSKPISLGFYPNPAGPWYTIWMALQSTEIEITTSKTEADILFVFDDNTQNAVPEDIITHTKVLDHKIYVNSRVTDISKTYVAKVFSDVFGYSVSVDPLTYKGVAVCKSDENGVHDGYLVELPISAGEVKPGSVYQILVDSTFDGLRSEDLRIAYVFGKIPVVYHKFKSINQRFGTTYLSTTICKSEDVFTEDELNKIIQFCKIMGLDFGAVDVMRDKVTQLIYIVDVNKTCMPVLSLPKAGLIEAMEHIGATFSDEVKAKLSNFDTLD